LEKLFDYCWDKDDLNRLFLRGEKTISNAEPVRAQPGLRQSRSGLKQGIYDYNTHRFRPPLRLSPQSLADVFSILKNSP